MFSSRIYHVRKPKIRKPYFEEMILGELNFFNIELGYFLLKISYFVKYNYNLIKENSSMLKNLLEHFLSSDSSFVSSYLYEFDSETALSIKIDIKTTEFSSRIVILKFDLEKDYDECLTLVLDNGSFLAINPLNLEFSKPSNKSEKEESVKNLFL